MSDTESDWDTPDALKTLQIDVQKLCEENKALKEENKVNAEPPQELVAHETAIVINARNIDRYKTALTQESAFLDELYHGFPERVHVIMESSYFAELVLKSIMDARSITSATNLTYTTFPPVLFPNLIEDKSLKTILKVALRGVTSLHQGSSHGGSAHTISQKWGIHQVTPGSIAWAAIITIFFLSPDTEFSGSGVGKKSNINYKELFYNYKHSVKQRITTKVKFGEISQSP
ncbi:hypothetical protein P692DRAFT_20851225 [Suillus brevipes Sb2]|nr:hypothetical protein P692DRAFT_20851225 [Suillus brevipes Sb2]